MVSNETFVSYPLPDQGRGEGDEEPSFYPPFKWGLGHCFRTHSRLFIKDLLTLKPMAMFPMAYDFLGHPIYKVEILGNVVLIDSRPRMDVYGLDDGTGRLKCVLWKTEPNFVDHSTLEALGGAKLASLRLGSLVSFTGKIKTYQDRNELCVEGCHVVDQWRELVLFRNLTMRDYQDQYFRPCVFPFQVAEVLKDHFYEKASGRKSRRWVKARIERGVLETLDKAPKGQMFSMELLDDPELRRIATECGEEPAPIFPDILAGLESKGLVYFLPFGSQKARYCVLVSRESDLSKSVLRTLKRLRSTSPSESGYQASDVVKSIWRSNDDFCLVKKVAVERCLEMLEDDNDVYSVGKFRYMPL